MLEHLKEACGIFGVLDVNHRSVFSYIYWGLRAQNHRGHQSHGFTTFDGKFHEFKNLDLVPKIKKDSVPKWVKRLPGYVGIGHVRYATSGGTDKQSLMESTQPIIDNQGKIQIAIAFNGNVVNGRNLVMQINEKFPRFQFNFDAQIIARKLLSQLKEGDDLVTSIQCCIEEIEGAFSVVGITEKGELFAFKDPYGIRPLCFGCSKDQKTYAVSSETVGLDINGFDFCFEINPGELVIISENGYLRKQLVKCKKTALCAFEFAYFARPDSRIGEKIVYEAREEFGRNLGSEHPETIRNVDIILSMPETGNDAAFGLHEATGKRWERASRRHRYVADRAFILLPDERFSTIDKKINIVDHKIVRKNVAVVDDSIVRGDTTKVVVKKLQKMGADKVFLFITFPKIIGPCFYGVDMATYGELIGSRYKTEEIAKIIGVDKLHYQSITGFVKATGLSKNQLCLGCVTGKYPTPMAQKLADEMKERFERGYKEPGRIYEVALP